MRSNACGSGFCYCHLPSIRMDFIKAKNVFTLLIKLAFVKHSFLTLNFLVNQVLILLHDNSQYFLKFK